MRLSLTRFVKTLPAWIIFSALSALAAQADSQTTPQDILVEIYKKYDSLTYISFDVKYNYSTDTLYGDFKNEVLNGSYTMAGKKAKYRIGDVDFMQNDTVMITIYNREKFMIISNPKSKNSGNELPMRDLMNNMITSNGQHYNITTLSDSVTGQIRFDRADSVAQFNHFVIAYNNASKFLTSLNYEYDEIEEPEETADTVQLRSLPISIRKKRLNIEFDNYRVDNFQQEIYDPYSYIWDEEGEWKPVTKYKGYKVYNSKTANTSVN